MQAQLATTDDVTEASARLEFLDYVHWGGKAHPRYERHHDMAWGPRQNGPEPGS